MIGRSSAPGIALLMFALGAAAQDERREPPVTADLSQAEKLIKDVFKEEYAKKTSADRLSLAKKLLAQALETKDDLASKFVLLREARDLATLAGDLQVAFSAVDELAKSFKVDTGALRSTLLVNAAKSAKTPEEFKAIAGASLKQIDALLVEDDYDAAEKLASSALANARKSQDVGLANRAAAKGKEVADLKSRFDKLKKPTETLAANPDDGPANLLVGRFQCLIKGNWRVGLPLLAKASDPALQALAAKELAAPADGPGQLAVGDGWWDLSEKEPAPSKDLLKDHAVVWYEKSVSKLNGLAKTKIEKRLSEYGAQKLARGSWLDATDPRLFGSGGKLGDPISLGAKKGFYQNIRMTQFPKGEFDGLNVRITLDPATDVMGWIVYEQKSLSAYLDTSRNEFICGRDGGDVWNREHTSTWVKKEEAVVTILAVDGEFVVYLDGRERARVKTQKPRITYLLLEVRDGAAKFDKIQLRRVE